YENGPAYGLAATTLAGGITTTLLFGVLMTGLIRRNRVINEKVDRATAALRRSGEEQTAILESATSVIAFVKDGGIVRGKATRGIVRAQAWGTDRPAPPDLVSGRPQP